jgi:Putative peptidoglycan binding domain/Tetratricopeptide repeat
MVSPGAQKFHAANRPFPRKVHIAAQSHCGLAAIIARHFICVAFLVMGDVHVAFSQPSPVIPLPTNSDFVRILPDNMRAIAVSAFEKRYVVINIATGETGARSLTHTVSDIALGSRPYLYLVGAKEADAGSAIVSRLDWESGSIVSVEIPGRFTTPSIAIDREGAVLLGNREDRRVTIISATEFNKTDVLEKRLHGKPTDVVVSYSTGVGDLGVTPDGRYILAALADGSEIILVDREHGRISSRYRLIPLGTSGMFASTRSMKVVAGPESGVNSTTPTILYGSSGLERDDFFTFVVNETFRALDVVQAVKVNFARDVRGTKPTDAIEFRSAMIVASDDDQQNILLGSTDSTHVLWFRRRGNIVLQLGEAVQLEVAPVDVDVSGDGQLAVVLHKDRPAITVLRGMDLAARVTSGMPEGRSCELFHAQLYLANQGYPVGAVDGIYGPQTRDALRAFQVNSGLNPTGVLDNATSAKLLEKEIRLARRSSQQKDISPSERAFTLSRLGFSLTDRWERNHDEKDLDDRVVAYRSALESGLNPSEPIEEASYENNFCFALAEAGHYKKDPALLEEAIAMCRSALAKLSADESPALWASTQHSLGFGLWKRYEQTGDESILAEAAEAIRSALNILEKNDPDCNLVPAQKDLQSIEALREK